MPATRDYRERVEQVQAPKDLKPGFYFLLASPDPRFNRQNGEKSVACIWVSDLALVMRTPQTLLEGFVLEANSGNPVAGAEVQAWGQAGFFRQTWNLVATTQSDQNGLFHFQDLGKAQCLILARFRDQQLASAHEYSSTYMKGKISEPDERTFFFTDRSLYRPGQTIQYKGICVLVDQEKDNYKTIAHRSLTVVFTDSNQEVIARQQVKTNDYGSFSGNFTAPRDRLMGNMVIGTERTPQGSTQIYVEEYKRPKFQVTLEPPTTAPRLNDKVVLSGKAVAYTGAAVNGAKVRWRGCQVGSPFWWAWCYWGHMPNLDQQEIAHGMATTQPDGSFPIEFLARPDLSVAEKYEPIFSYAIFADVTDTTGETRSGEQTIKVGYTALGASLTADAWQTDQKPVEIAITTHTLDGQPQPAEGLLKVYHLKQPAKVVRPTYVPGWSERSSRHGSGREGPPKPDLSNPNSWELGEKAREEKFRTDATGTVKKAFKLAAGPYRAVVETRDRQGKPVTALLPLQVLQPQGKTIPIRLPQIVAAPKWTLKPGEEFLALWGTGYDSGRAFIEIEHRDKIVQAFWTPAGATQQIIKQVVTEAHRGGFTLRVTMVRENRGYLADWKIDVPWSNKNLTVQWEHFTSKLEPSQKETWTAVITGPEARKATAEMVAALYDESLDAYLPHNWLQPSSVFRQDFSSMRGQFENNMEFLHYWPVLKPSVRMTYRSFPKEIIEEDSDGSGASPVFLGRGGVGMLGGMVGMGGLGGMGGLDLGDGVPLRSMGTGPIQARPQGLDLSKVSTRKNLNETAFFFPHLIADSEGKVKLEFTMPEALTRWKFLALAHDNDLRSGFLEAQAVTAKDLMVQPNPPRFLREGDVVEFTVKVSNQASTRQQGTVRLTLADARTARLIDAALGNTQLDQVFDIPAKESRSFAWRLTVPDGQGPIRYKAVGSTDRLSDGEEGFLPVLRGASW